MSYLVTIEEEIYAGDLVQKLTAKHVYNEKNNYSFVRPDLYGNNILNNNYMLMAKMSDSRVKQNIKYFDNIIEEVKKNGKCIFEENKEEKWIYIYSYNGNNVGTLCEQLRRSNLYSVAD